MQEISGTIIAQKLIADCGVLPRSEKIFAAVLVGDDTDSRNFLREKEKVANKLGIHFKKYSLPGDWTSDRLQREVETIARQGSVGALVVQLPLPRGVNPHEILSAIPREKDADVLGEQALGAFYSGQSSIMPPAVAALEEIVKFVGCDIAGKKVAVVGPGFLVGKPIIVRLLGKVKNVFVIDAGGDFSPLKMADVVVCGSGVAGVVKPDMLKDGAGVVDFGYGRDAAGKLAGDFAAYELSAEDKKRLAFYTPTPGGTGPVVIAELFKNFFALTAPN